jgi:hypothetical protein
MELDSEILKKLGAAFPEEEIGFLPKAQSNGKALGLAFVDARTVMRRLDQVVGPSNWSFDFDLLDPHGKMVRGKLTVCGVTKCDAGQADREDEPLKSAVSDALKRCGVHFNIGRYIYELPQTWAPYDAQKRRWIEEPKLDPAAVRRALQICGVEAASRPLPAAGNGARPGGAPATGGAAGAPRANTWSPSSSGNERAHCAVTNAEQAPPPVEAPPPMDEAPATGLFDGAGTDKAVCATCHEPVSEKVVKWCQDRRYGKTLCPKHQPKPGHAQ